MGKTKAADVAKAAGVSLATVDRVLNRRGGVSPLKERLVLDAARKLRLDRALDHRPGRTLRIAVLIHLDDNPFHVALREALRDTVEKTAAYNMRLFVEGLDPADARRMVARIRACETNYDGLIITSPAYPEVVAAARKVAARLPVVTLVTDLPESGRQAYVGPDDIKAGRVAADLMGRLMGREGGPVLVIAGLLSMSGQRDRVAGFEAVLRARYPRCRIAAIQESAEIAARAGRAARAFLGAHSGIRGIYNASVGARDVADAVEAAHAPADIVVVTHEMTPDRRALLQAGLIDAVIDQDPTHEVATALDTMARLLGRLDTAPEKDFRPPLHIHMRENA